VYLAIFFVVNSTSWEKCPFHDLASMLLFINKSDNNLFPFLSNFKNKSSYMNRLFKVKNHISANEKEGQQADNLIELLDTEDPRPLQN